jgi:Ca2+-binding EF-hand superfamily protein
LSSGV